MKGEEVIEGAAAPTIAVAREITADNPEAPTPCEDFSVRQLVNHLLFSAPPLVGAARKEAVPPPAASDRDADLTGGDWCAKLEADLSRLASAWGEPATWEGKARLGGPEAVPAAMIGGMVCTELVIHGWDLARATEQKPEWDDQVVASVHRELEATAEQGRSIGVYGPRGVVSDSASPRSTGPSA